MYAHQEKYALLNMMLGFVARKISMEAADIPTVSDVGSPSSAHRTLTIGHCVRALIRDASVDLPAKSAPSMTRIIDFLLAQQAIWGCTTPRAGRPALSTCTALPGSRSVILFHLVDVRRESE